MNPMKDDELMLLWRQGTSAEPIPAEISRLAGRASIRQFDRVIFWRNFREYAAGLMLFAFFGWLLVTGKARALGMLQFVYGGALGVGFVLAYLWWRHRDLTPLDPSAGARVYQAAMLARIDKQIRLLGSVRYWYLLPLYIPGLWVIKQTWKRDPIRAVLGLGIYTGVFVFVGWLNERWGVRRLQAQRAKIQGLYEE
jgi:hypothetical protein